MRARARGAHPPAPQRGFRARLAVWLSVSPSECRAGRPTPQAPCASPRPRGLRLRARPRSRAPEISRLSPPKSPPESVHSGRPPERTPPPHEGHHWTAPLVDTSHGRPCAEDKILYDDTDEECDAGDEAADRQDLEPRDPPRSRGERCLDGSQHEEHHPGEAAADAEERPRVELGVHAEDCIPKKRIKF